MIQIPTVTFTQAITAASVAVTLYLVVDSWLLQRKINKALCGIVKATRDKEARDSRMAIADKQAEWVTDWRDADLKGGTFPIVPKPQTKSPKTPIGCGGPSLISKVTQDPTARVLIQGDECGLIDPQGPTNPTNPGFDTYNAADDQRLLTNPLVTCDLRHLHGSAKYPACPRCKLIDLNYIDKHGKIELKEGMIFPG